VELVESGANILTGANENKIEAAIQQSLLIPQDIFSQPLYGNGDAGLLIAKAII